VPESLPEFAGVIRIEEDHGENIFFKTGVKVL
jgi:hypothetical protein